MMTRKRNILTVLLLSVAPAAASPSAGHAPPADTEVAKPLLELRSKLFQARDKAQVDVARFRPLCDKDGYPLVGNVAAKGNVYQPSQFCSDVRKTEKRS